MPRKREKPRATGIHHPLASAILVANARLARPTNPKSPRYRAILGSVKKILEARFHIPPSARNCYFLLRIFKTIAPRMARHSPDRQPGLALPFGDEGKHARRTLTQPR